MQVCAVSNHLRLIEQGCATVRTLSLDVRVDLVAFAGCFSAQFYTFAHVCRSDKTTIQITSLPIDQPSYYTSTRDKCKASRSITTPREQINCNQTPVFGCRDTVQSRRLSSDGATENDVGRIFGKPQAKRYLNTSFDELCSRSSRVSQRSSTRA